MLLEGIKRMAGWRGMMVLEPDLVCVRSGRRKEAEESSDVYLGDCHGASSL
jgi:hypothetical protein